MMLMTGVRRAGRRRSRSAGSSRTGSPRSTGRIRGRRPPTPIPLPSTTSSPTTSTGRPAHRPTCRGGRWWAGTSRSTRRSWACSATIAAMCPSTETAISSCAPRRKATPTSAAGSRANMKIGIGHTWEARIKLNCLVPGCWPAYWLVNREPTPDGRGPLPDGEVDILEWYGNGKWAPGTAVHARSDGRTWRENRWPVDGDWHTYRVQWDDAGFRFWRDDLDGAPYFTVPCRADRRGVAVQRARLPAVHGLQPRGRRSRWR